MDAIDRAICKRGYIGNVQTERQTWEAFEKDIKG